jgi:hypothetical protein
VRVKISAKQKVNFLKKLLIRPIVLLCSLSFYKGTKVKGEKMDEW